MTSIEKWGSSLAYFGIAILGGAIGSRIPALGVLKGVLVGSGAVLGILGSSGCGDRVTYTVTECPNDSASSIPLDVPFEIDCSDFSNRSEQCKTYLDNTACHIYPAFKKITQLSLKSNCSRVWYGISSESRWHHSVAGYSDIPDCKEYWVDTHSILAPAMGGSDFDSHELLHQLQSLIFYSYTILHPLFITTVVEAQRLGDPEGYPGALQSINLYYQEGMFIHPEKVQDCTEAQKIIEMGLYLQDKENIYKSYDLILKKHQSFTESLLSSVLFMVSGKDHSVQKYLLDHNCTKF